MSRTILFVTPPYHCGVVEVAGHWMPLGLVYLAAAARRAGWTPMIYDAMTKRHEHAQIREHISKTKPDCVATTSITPTFPDCLELLRNAKDVLPNVITIMGGVHPTFMFKDILQESPDVVDYIVRGEGEETLEELLRCIAQDDDPEDVRGLSFPRDSEILYTPSRKFAKSIEMAHDEWDLLDWNDYTYFVIPKSRLAVVSTSRGCSFSCTFCSQQKFWKQSWRARGPGLAADEILNLQKKYGANVFLITDEYPTQDQDRWEAFLDRLIYAKFDGYLLIETRAADIVRDAHLMAKYRKAGVIHIYIGLEATDQQTLDTINKELVLDESKECLRLIREHGMVSETAFVLGFPWETPETIAATLKLSQEYDPDFAHYLAITPWPYADIYEEMKPHIRDFDYRKYNLIDPVIKPVNMTLEEVDRAIVNCYRDFYMGKLPQIAKDKDPFRKHYLLVSMRLIMRSSFLKKKMGNLGTIPAEVDRMLKRLGIKSEEAKKKAVCPIKH
jgi:anaerobic magnesium-protoporphyrin IX monomethyl ester cyclase